MHKSVVLALASIASFTGSLDISIVNVAIPAIAKSLQATFAEIILIPTVYLVTLSILQPVVGQLADRRGMKRIFVVGLCVFVTGSFLSGLAGTSPELLVFRIVQGAGAAVSFSIGTALVVNTYPSNERGRALGINLGVIYGGLATGPAIGGLLVQAFGWRAIFYVNVPIGIAVAALAALYLQEEKVTRTSARFDYEGALTLAIFLGTALILLSGLGLSTLWNIIMGVVCLASFVTFVLLERRQNIIPLIDLKLFTQNRTFAAGNATSLMNYVTSAGALLLVSLYVQLILGYSPEAAGLILLVQPVTMAITAVVAGTLSDRFSAQILSSLGMAVRVVAFILLARLGTTSSESSIIGPLVLIGVGHALFSSPNTNSVMSAVRSDQLGIASGTMGTVRSAAQSIGVAVLGGVVAANMPAGAFAALSDGTAVASSSTASLFVVGMRQAFLLAAVFSAIGIFTSLVRGKQNGGSPRTAGH